MESVQSGAADVVGGGERDGNAAAVHRPLTGHPRPLRSTFHSIGTRWPFTVHFPLQRSLRPVTDHFPLQRYT